MGVSNFKIISPASPGSIVEAANTLALIVWPFIQTFSFLFGIIGMVLSDSSSDRLWIKAVTLLLLEKCKNSDGEGVNGIVLDIRLFSPDCSKNTSAVSPCISYVFSSSRIFAISISIISDLFSNSLKAAVFTNNTESLGIPACLAMRICSLVMGSAPLAASTTKIPYLAFLNRLAVSDADESAAGVLI